MAQESKKAIQRRMLEGFFHNYLVSPSGVDIGCGDNPVTGDCTRWDLPQGDAQKMEGVEDESFDWVYSSHCLEHLVDPSEALVNWWRILRPGGYLVVVVPDEDLYEQGVWPSRFNPDHKTTWTIWKAESWSPVSRNLASELGRLPGGQIKYLRLIDYLYDYVTKEPYDRSWGLSEVGIEAVVRKVPRDG